MTLWLIAALLGASDNPASLDYGRALQKQFDSGQLQQLWDASEVSFRRQFPTAASLQSFVAKVRGDFGNETRVVSEALGTRGEAIVYTRSGTWSRYARGVDVEWVYDAAGFLLGLQVRKASKEAPSPHLGQEPTVRLRLPFEGSWLVLWGGSSWDENRHASVSDQRFALDWLQWKGKASFEGAGTRNEEYACFGQPVLAPADGTVVVAEDDLPDNVPGSPSVKRVYGNYVVIKHNAHEYSLLAHLKRGSVAVKAGEVVRQGQRLAMTGNSGTSTEPHLHYQLMDGPDWKKAHGRPAWFDQYFADGALVTRGEPKRGQTLRDAPGVDLTR